MSSQLNTKKTLPRNFSCLGWGGGGLQNTSDLQRQLVNPPLFFGCSAKFRTRPTMEERISLSQEAFSG